ncbi:MAG: hypothetical protein Q4G09_07060 [Clostridia bacterium]|nr:hypothetical protein [Clostridia bacterium]
MPNNCLNRVTASKEVLDALYNYKKKEVTYKKLIPMPKRLNLTEGSIKNSAITYAFLQKSEKERIRIVKMLCNKKLKETKTLFQNFLKYQDNFEELKKMNKEFKPKDEEIALKIRTFKQLGEIYLKNIAEYGYATWYEWAINKWGTKWDAYDSIGTPESGELEFLSAWNPPNGIVKKLFEKFPEEKINWYYEEPGMDFAGNYISDGNGNYIDVPCPVPNYNEEEEEE